MGKAGGAAITAPRGLGKSQVVAFPILARQEGGLWKSNEWNFSLSFFFFLLFPKTHSTRLYPVIPYTQPIIYFFLKEENPKPFGFFFSPVKDRRTQLN